MFQPTTTCCARLEVFRSPSPPDGPPPKSLQTPRESLMVPGGSGIGPERALERPHPDPPSRDSAKAPPVPTFPASAGPIPRSPCNNISIVKSVPFCVNRWDRPPAAAGSGRSERWNVDTLIPPRATARKLLLSQRSLRAQDRSRGASSRLSPIATQPHGRTRNTATHPAPTRSPRQTALTHDASEPLRVLYRK